jgi:DUF4097 and DUF4098 domain-containing protein YvlB
MTLRTFLSFAAGLLAVATALTALPAAASGVTLKEHFEKTVPLHPGLEVRLHNGNGAVTFEAWDRPEVGIVAEKQVRAGSDETARKVMAQVQIEVAPGPAGVRIETHTPKTENSFLAGFLGQEINVEVSYKVHLPRQAAVAIENANGGVELTGTHGKTHLKTSNGPITVREAEGDLDLESTNGAIGVIHSAGSLQADTSNGSIHAELTRFTPKDLRLETSNGAVVLRLPRDSRFSVDAETSNGSVQSDFPVPGEKTGRNSLKGHVNGGGTTVYVRTSNGGVQLKGI